MFVLIGSWDGLIIGSHHRHLGRGAQRVPLSGP